MGSQVATRSGAPGKTLPMFLTTGFLLVDYTIDLTAIFAFKAVFSSPCTSEQTLPIALTHFAAQCACFALTGRIIYRFLPRFPITTLECEAEILHYGEFGDGGPASLLATRHAVPRVALLVALGIIYYVGWLSASGSDSHIVSIAISWLMTRIFWGLA